MPTYKVIKAVVLNLGIIIINIIFFSPGFIGLQLREGNALEGALGGTLILMSIIIFIWGNVHYLIVKEKVIVAAELKSKEDYKIAIRQNAAKNTFTKSVFYILKQVERLDKKNAVIHDVLLQKFNSEELSFRKFSSVLKQIEELFYLNLRSIINRLNVFDQEEYNQIAHKKAKLSSSIEAEKRKVYEEYISFIEHSIEDNEQILLKLDQLLLELSKFNSLEDGEIEAMPAMLEIDELISKTKLYQ
ncbi:hypothetical protein [Cellulosilyticum lentocellum]|uniref:Uncharacterized protein n=1 Tax=Cellulosilyticum lentocellum (strain ATCC 49066 / DSM 5427 / NCIMB 11756 / RHM5) TaxID=642492 RepID=F2JM76_CELLD|nr:hypothetical protein [Cellulosilyticum lentocellum]ADZ82287.1 hypothetical protein Clole_0551 [Cellulosilyticum lentocellum DSM 5427]